MIRAGVFDSGVGGLTVVKSLLEHKLFDEIIYFGDTARVPYGTKNKNTIIRYSLEAMEFFKNYDIDIMIAACNSVSAYAIKDLKESAPFAISGVIEPGVLALKNKITDKNAKILILGTKATIQSEKYERLLKKQGYKNIESLAPSLFVPIIEEGLFDGEILKITMKHYFKNIEKPDAIILGCTHFPLISEQISSFFPDSILIHSGEAVVEFLESSYKISKKNQESTLKLFASDDPDGLKKIANSWLNY
jgi:glutamate racemase